MDLTDFIAKLKPIKQKLFRKRESRIRPSLDKKVITAWNGLIITALAESSTISSNSENLQAAMRAAESIWERNFNNQKTLLRLNLKGKASTNAVLEDYSYLAESYLALFDISGKKIWLKRAETLVNSMTDTLWDDSNGGFFNANVGTSTPLIAHSKTIKDSALPAGNAVAFLVLNKLANITGNLQYKNKANILLEYFSASCKDKPSACAYFMLAIAESSRQIGGKTVVFGAGVGRVKVKGTSSGSDKVKLQLNIALKPGWHINSDKPHQKYLIPTKLTLADFDIKPQLYAITYPEPIEWRIEGMKETVAVFESQFEIKSITNLEGTESKHRIIPLQLQVQACNNTRCLSPENLRLNAYY